MCLNVGKYAVSNKLPGRLFTQAKRFLGTDLFDFLDLIELFVKKSFRALPSEMESYGKSWSRLTHRHIKRNMLGVPY